MGWFEVQHRMVACSRCTSPLARATWRRWPAHLEVFTFSGSGVVSERAGRVVQRMDVGEGLNDMSDPTELRRWLSHNAIEVLYELHCSEHGRVWVLGPDLYRAMRRAPATAAWVQVPTH